MNERLLLRFQIDTGNIPAIEHLKWGIPSDLDPSSIEYGQSYYGDGNLIYQDWFAYEDGILRKGVDIIGN